MSAVLPMGTTTDAALDATFQAFISGVTGLPGDNVRPRWQQIPPPQPDISIDWCAFGIIDTRPIYGAQITSNPPGENDNGSINYALHESIDLLVTFYGPDAGNYAWLLRDGAQIPQNLQGLESVGMGYVESGPIRTVSELVNQQWLRRVDIPLYLRRVVTRVYAIPNVAVTQIDLIDDTGHVNRVIPVPPPTSES